MKNKDSLGLNANLNMFGQNGLNTDLTNDVVIEQEDDEAIIEREFDNFKRENKVDFEEEKPRVASERSAGSEDYDHQDAAVAPSKQIKRVTKQTLFYNPNDEDYIK